MTNLIKFAALSALAVSMTACNSSSSSKATGPDLGVVLDRTIMTLEYAEANFEKPADADAPEDEAATEAMFTSLTGIMHQVMNSEPQFYGKPIGVSLREDAAFLGFADSNGDNVQDAGEKDIFTVEIDAERNRLIATDMVSGEGTYRLSGTGLLVGFLAGRLLGRQGRSGVKPASFANRNVKSSADYRKSRPAPRARSSSRSGSSRSGK